MGEVVSPPAPRVATIAVSQMQYTDGPSKQWLLAIANWLDDNCASEMTNFEISGYDGGGRALPEFAFQWTMKGEEYALLTDSYSHTISLRRAVDYTGLKQKEGHQSRGIRTRSDLELGVALKTALEVSIPYALANTDVFVNYDDNWTLCSVL